MILNLNNDNSTDGSRSETVRKDPAEAKAFAARAERVIQWGGLEYNLNKLYKNVLDLAERAEDCGIEEDYAFRLSMRRIDSKESYDGGGTGIDGLLDVFRGANAYMSGQLGIMTGKQNEAGERQDETLDVAGELSDGCLREAMHAFAGLCEELGDAINAKVNFDDWLNVSISILKDGQAWTSEIAPLARPTDMSDIFGEAADVINGQD